jgi:Tripartite tricarboxylate transporter TctA family
VGSHRRDAGGLVYGLVIGSLPGLSATMATALLVPVTFYLSPIAAIATIVAASSMAIFSGDIPARCCASRERLRRPPMRTKPTP